MKGDELLGMRVRQRIEEHGVDDGKQGSVGADAQSQGEDRDGREAGIFSQRAGSVAQVLQEFFEPEPTPLVAGDLLYQRDVAEFAADAAKWPASRGSPRSR